MNLGPVAVLFDRFGPYHCARLLAAARRMNILALELCGQSREYAWDPVTTEGAFPRETLFPDRDRSALSAVECRRRICAVLDAHRPAAVAVPGWASPAALAALEWCARRARPAVVMSESAARDKSRLVWKEAIKRRIVSRCAAAGLVGGRLHTEYLATLGTLPERVFSGYDVVDNAYFIAKALAAREQAAAMRASLGLPERYLLACCRFVEEKNLFRLMEAYAAYRDGVGPALAVPLMILGDGPLRAQILLRREALDLCGNVLLPGFKQYGQLPAHYALADGFVHASVSEPWGLVVNEAMACGLPTLVSNRCGCAPDLVSEGGNGWTFDPYDVPALAGGLRRLADLSPAQREAMGRCSRERIAGYSPEAFAVGLQRAADSALSTPPFRPGWVDGLLLRALTLCL